ncbi:MAG: hypothetical protein QOE70_6616 [Chthoniobacter sp.]|nr:hypothetical protein [Chthoniobacter sp.]
MENGRVRTGTAGILHLVMRLCAFTSPTTFLMPNELDNAQRLHRAVIAAAERCHRDLAESVHGTLCQTLGGAGIMAQVLAAGVKAGQSVDSSQLESLAETLDRALDEARQVLMQLQPVAPGQDGLMTALARLAAETTAGQSICTFECEDAVLIDNPDAALSFYRVAKEAVKNAVENALAQHIRILLRERNGAIALTVADDGQVFPPKARTDEVSGVEVMRFRALAAGGEFTLGSESGVGTKVTFTLPQEAARAWTDKDVRNPTMVLLTWLNRSSLPFRPIE